MMIFKSKIKIFPILPLAILFLVMFYSVNVIQAAPTPSTINLSYPWSEEKTPAGLVNRFYDIALGLGGVAAFGVLIYGAILYSLSGAVASQQEAKDWIWGAIWGLILLLSAFLILKTINPDLVKLSTTIIPSSYGSVPPSVPLGPTYTDKEAREILAANGIGINKNNCSTATQTDCTSFERIPKKAIDELIAMKNSCGCPLTVTGATEAGHWPHGPGQPVMDIRNSTSFDNWILANSKPIPGKNNWYASNDGKIQFYDERNKAGVLPHWHTVYKI